mmetsp:Transcript_4824/g.8363  ORF Transcript_4824/g.8363 Transcript_4824/m.8363 type:complete len:211 (+) Transcript_4824:1035-1667(+)
MQEGIALWTFLLSISGTGTKVFCIVIEVSSQGLDGLYWCIWDVFCARIGLRVAKHPHTIERSVSPMHVVIGVRMCATLKCIKGSEVVFIKIGHHHRNLVDSSALGKLHDSRRAFESLVCVALLSNPSFVFIRVVLFFRYSCCTRRFLFAAKLIRWGILCSTVAKCTINKCVVILIDKAICRRIIHHAGFTRLFGFTSPNLDDALVLKAGE